MPKNVKINTEHENHSFNHKVYKVIPYPKNVFSGIEQVSSEVPEQTILWAKVI